MINDIKQKLSELGWTLAKDNFDSPFNIKQEVKEYILIFFVSLAALIPLTIIVLFLYVKMLLVKKKKLNKILFGPHIVVFFKLLKKALENDFDTEIFIYDDYSQKVKNSKHITPEQIMPKWISTNARYLLGRYWAFVWSLNNFDIYVHYFNSGFLDKTLLWRLEPLIYQLLNKKIILFPHGSDTWDILRNHNRYAKVGHMVHAEKYFSLDDKRIKRMYWWSKYSNLIFGQVNFIDFLPRIDIFAYRCEIVSDREIYEYKFPDTSNKIKAIHYANDGIRKGSHFIKQILEELHQERNDFEYEIYEQLDRETALKALDDAHIFIEQITDGFFSLSATEAMLKGKVVLSKVDNDLLAFFHYLNKTYYDDNTNIPPTINSDPKSLKQNLIYLLDNKQKLKAKSIKSKQYAEKILKDNEKAFHLLFTSFIREINNE